MKTIVSTSGGLTSMYVLLSETAKNPDTQGVFANTGQENEETLQFIRNCDREWGLNIIWLESVFDARKGKATTHKIVSFDTAHRGNDLFDEMIKIYGIPNKAYPHCTRELKNQPIKSFCISNYGRKGYKIAIGIRAEETNRYPKQGSDNPYRLYYPCIEDGIDKDDIHIFWEDKPVTLKSPNYRNNCKRCYKKSDEKLALIHHENPEFFDHPKMWEKEMGLCGSNKDGTHRVHWSGNRSTEQLIESFPVSIDTPKDFRPDKPRIDYEYLRKRIIKKYEMLSNGGCADSCDAFQDDMFTDNDLIPESVKDIKRRHIELYPQPVIWSPSKKKKAKAIKKKKETSVTKKEILPKTMDIFES